MKATWIHKRFSEVCTLKKGKKPKLHAEFQQGFAPYLIARYLRGAATSEFVDIRDKNAVLIKKDQIFVICDGSNSGEIFTGFEGVLSSTMALIEHTEAIDSRFLRFFLDSLFEQFNEGKTGSAIPHLDLAALRVESLPLPPLSEQHRIVAILDTAFDQISTARANCEANLLNARAIFESHLQAVFTQRGDGWVEKRLGDIFNIGSSKRILETEWTTAGVPFYGGREIVKLAKSGTVLSNSYISEEKYSDYASKYDMPRQDDILITARGTIGVGYVVQEGDKFYYKDGNIISMRGKTPTNPYFMLYAFRSNVMADQLGILAGTTVKHLPIEKAKELILRIPKFAVQNTVVEQIREVEAETQRLETLYQRKLQALDDLKKSLLHQAFSGLL